MQLGGYDVLKKLGEGGTAKVYLAEKRGLGGFRKLCVLKCLKPALAQDPVIRADFFAEARLSAHMSHPNVVQVYEAFEVSGVPILAMEHLDGPPLSTLRHQLGSALSLELELLVLTEALKGLHYVHELAGDDGRPLGVVHRDVSPQNLVVTYDGDVKVLDFGIAKLAGSSQTEYGVIKGKISYLAPEQLRTSETDDTIDRRADLFAVGILLWEAAAGRSMWTGFTEGEVLVRLIEGRVPKLSAASSPCVDALTPIIERALELDPNDRFATAEEMRQALLPILDAATPRPTTAHLKALLETHYGKDRTGRKRMELASASADDSAFELFRSLSDASSSAVSSNLLTGPRALTRRRKRRVQPRWMWGGALVSLLLLAGLGYTRWAASRAASSQPDASSGAPNPDADPETETAADALPREAAPCHDTFTVADFEAGWAEACRTEGRRGGTIVFYYDGTGETTPAIGVLGSSDLLEPPRGTSRHALHLRATGLTDWGSGISIKLDEGRPVDLRAYEGLRLWMRSDSGARTRISVATRATLDETYGGRCVPDPKVACNDHYTTLRSVNTFWQEFRVPFSGLQQLGWGKAGAWEPEHTMEIHIGVHNGENGETPETRAEHLSFDLWIDDLSFY